jgi:hypothetical protein
MKIPVANLSYLLSYAWQRLPDGGNLADLFARFLGHGFLRLARRGLDRGYVERDGEMGALCGRRPTESQTLTPIQIFGGRSSSCSLGRSWCSHAPGSRSRQSTR